MDTKISEWLKANKSKYSHLKLAKNMDDVINGAMCLMIKPTSQRNGIYSGFSLSIYVPNNCYVPLSFDIVDRIEDSVYFFTNTGERSINSIKNHIKHHMRYLDKLYSSKVVSFEKQGNSYYLNKRV